MAYAMKKVAFLIGVKVDDDNEEIGLQQGNYKFSPLVNAGYELYVVDAKGSKHKVEICEIANEDEAILDEYVE